MDSSAGKDPKSPWMPFSMLFEEVSAKVEPDHVRLVHIFYESFRVCFVFFKLFIQKKVFKIYFGGEYI